MTTVDGRKIAGEILKRLKELPKPKKFLAGVLVGENPASESFLGQKEKTARELGIDFRLYRFPADISAKGGSASGGKNDELREEVGKIAAHKTCGGVIVQLPLPEHVNRHYVLNAVPREKDVDVLGERALGALYTGRNPVLPPAAAVVAEVLRASRFTLHDLRVAVVGRGLLVGRPIATWLMGQVRELIVLGRNADLRILREADLVVSGVGKAGLLKPDMFKPEAGIIDFGYDDNKGDLDTSQLPNVSGQLSFYTPTPGGTGPILVAKLMENFYKLNL